MLLLMEGNSPVKVVITGANGFIGRNLVQRLQETQDVEIAPFHRGQTQEDFERLLKDADLVFHLAGVNRPKDAAEFESGNRDLTRMVCQSIGREVQATGRSISVVLAGSVQAEFDTDYGISKRAAEAEALAAAAASGFSLHIYRLPNVFGKWARPHYNSVVATFCQRIARDLPIDIHDPDAQLTLVYVDDVIESFMGLVAGATPPSDESGFATVQPLFKMTVGQIANEIARIHENRRSRLSGKVGMGLERALYATYMSYLPVEECSYPLRRHEDHRGAFVEMLRTPESGQFSFFTAGPGITRGGHYHHSKVEKFLVVKGSAHFRFRQVQSGETYDKTIHAHQSEVVETIPGWAHDITNVGTDELIVLLWASEIFEPHRPDTYQCSL